MAYSLAGDKLQLVTINGRIGGQQIITRLWYAYLGPLPNPDADVSPTWITNFRAAYLANILGSYYSPYTVFSYEMKELKTVALRLPGPPAIYKNVFDVNKIQTLLGVAGDIGGLAPGVNALMPVHDTMRIFLTPAARFIGFFKSNYLRTSGGWPDTLLDPAAPEKWLAATLATYSAQWTIMLGTVIRGVAVPVGSGWLPVLWSTNFYGREKLAGGFPLRDGCTTITNAVANAYVGTQTTRNFTPKGAFRGR